MSYDPRYDQRPVQRPPGAGIGARLLTGLIIALIGLIMYWSQSQENPVTHEKQHVTLSPSQEIKLGLQSAPQMAQQMGGEVPNNDPRAIEVRRLGAYIISKTDAEKSPWKFQFHLLADERTVNAFALPGGQIFITLGLYDKLRTEAQLAGVLSHEMGHVIERHTAQQMAKSQLGQMLIVAVGASTSSDQSGSSQLFSPVMIASVVNQMTQLHYSRHDEAEADMWGIKLMEQSGYDPRAMIAVMKILKAEGGKGHGMEMFQTHPDPDHRIQLINAFLEKNPPPAGLIEGKPLNQ